jgi:hypothetical protein
LVSQNVNKIFQAVQALTESEAEEFRRLLAQRDARAIEQAKQQQLQQILLQEGIISHTPEQKMTQERYEQWKPVPIEGEPLSETIIKDRR